MATSAKQQARRWQTALRRANPKDWDAISDRMVRSVAAHGGVRVLQDVGEEIKAMNTSSPALPVTIVSARDLDKKTEQAIVKQLFGEQDVSLTKRVDPELIAGVVVRTEDMQWDLSVRHQLQRLKRSIVEA